MTDEQLEAAQAKHRPSRLVIEILVLVAFLSVLTLWASTRAKDLLNGTLERSVARQAADFSVMADERFGRELGELTMAASAIGPNSDSEAARQILSALNTGIDQPSGIQKENITVGLLSVGYSPIIGNSLSRWDFLSLPQAFRGQNIVDYCQGRGLLFAVPILRDGNVCAVLYRLYGDDALPTRFTLTEYNPSVHLFLRDKLGHLIVPSPQYKEQDQQFCDSLAIRKTFGLLQDQLTTRRAASVYVEHEGMRCFVFASNLPRANCTVAGYIPWTTVAADIALVYSRLLRSIGFLLLIFFFAGVYIFLVRKKAAESEALRIEKIIADRANQAKSDFLAHMSHEIRTPINAVLGMNEMILREGKDPGIRRYAQNIRSAGQTLLDLINDVLDFSKIESGKIEISEGEYHLSELILNAVNMAKPRAESKGLAFGLTVDENLPDILWGDMTRLQQIVVNLLTNAAKYTEKGRVDFSVTGDRNDPENTITLQFTIKDTGIGIKDEDKPKLFTSFERLDPLRNRGIEGTGLGLPITKQLAELMGGHITFDSVYGEGSVFTVTIPQKIAGTDIVGSISTRTTAREEGEPYHVSFTAPEAEILIVDDNEVNLFVAVSLLKKTMIRMDTARSGEDALKLLTAKHYDVVLMDHRMPGMDGVETLHRAKELPGTKGTPFLIVTADAIAGIRERLLREGFDDYLTKPLDGTLLEQTLAKYLPLEKVRPASDDDSPETAPNTLAALSDETEDEILLLDTDIGLQYCGGDESLYRDLLSMFADVHPQKMAQMDETFRLDNWDDYVTYVHALKSNALSIGSRLVSRDALALESRGRLLIEGTTPEEAADSLSFLRLHHEELMKEYTLLAETARNESTKEGPLKGHRIP